MKIRIFNFQSIQEAELEVRGFTAITGPSNLGKSAFVRAYLAAVMNRRGNDFVTKGKDTCDISIEKDTHTVRWVKGPKVTEYYIDGAHNPKAGRSTPKEEIAHALGVFPISAQGSLYYPQIQRQFDKPFIVSESSPTVAAELLSASKDNQILTTAIKLADKDHKKKETEIEIRDGQIKSLKQRVLDTEVLSQAIQQSRERASLAYAEWQVAKSRAQALDQLLVSYKRVQAVISAVDKAPKQQLPNPPERHRAPTLESLLRRYQQVQRTLIAAKLVEKEIPVISVDLERRRKLEDISSRYDKVYAVSLFSQIEGCVPEVTQAVEAVKYTSNLDALSTSYKAALRTFEESQTEASALSREEQQADKEILSILNELGICPTCKQSTRSIAPNAECLHEDSVGRVL